MRWAKISGYNHTCDCHANYCGPFSQAGADDISEYLGIGTHHERFSGIRFSIGGIHGLFEHNGRSPHPISNYQPPVTRHF